MQNHTKALLYELQLSVLLTPTTNTNTNHFIQFVLLIGLLFSFINTNNSCCYNNTFWGLCRLARCKSSFLVGESRYIHIHKFSPLIIVSSQSKSIQNRIVRIYYFLFLFFWSWVTLWSSLHRSTQLTLDKSSPPVREAAINCDWRKLRLADYSPNCHKMGFLYCHINSINMSFKCIHNHKVTMRWGAWSPLSFLHKLYLWTFPLSALRVSASP